MLRSDLTRTWETLMGVGTGGSGRASGRALGRGSVAGGVCSRAWLQMGPGGQALLQACFCETRGRCLGYVSTLSGSVCKAEGVHRWFSCAPGRAIWECAGTPGTEGG